jgi:hypothetical protein
MFYAHSTQKDTERPRWSVAKLCHITGGSLATVWRLVTSQLLHDHTKRPLRKFLHNSRLQPKYKQDRQCTYKRNIMARSPNHCCRIKAISTTHSECVCSFSFSLRHEMRMRRIVLSSAACLALPYFSILSHKRYDFRNEWSYTSTPSTASYSMGIGVISEG